MFIVYKLLELQHSCIVISSGAINSHLKRMYSLFAGRATFALFITLGAFKIG